MGRAHLYDTVVLGELKLDGNDLRVALELLSSPRRTHALAALCEHLNRSPTRFPGSTLRLHFVVKPPPEIRSTSQDLAATVARATVNRTFRPRSRSGGLDSCEPKEAPTCIYVEMELTPSHRD